MDEVPLAMIETQEKIAPLLGNLLKSERFAVDLEVSSVKTPLFKMCEYRRVCCDIK